MRFAGLISAGFALAMAPAALAQGWFEYVSRDYGFLVNFPAEPKMEDTTYTAAGGVTLPAKRFTAEPSNGRYAGRYSVLVVDYSTRTTDEDGAMAHAANMLRPKGQIKFEEPSQLDGIPGHQLSIIEPNGQQTQIQLFMYSYNGFHRLYIAEGSVPAGAAPPAAFWTSLAMVHPDGRIVNINRERRGDFGPPTGGYVAPGQQP